MPPWLRLLGLALVAGPLLLLWERPDLLAFRPADGTFPPLPAPRRGLPNPERCVVIGTEPDGIDIAFAVPPAGRHVRWWCDDDRVYFS